jgi:hypothetical protein
MTDAEQAALRAVLDTELTRALAPLAARLERLEAEASRLAYGRTPKDAEVQHLTPRQAAYLLVAMLERDGATFTLNADGYFVCNLDGIPNYNHAKAESMSQCVLALREEIRDELHSRRVTH